MEKTQYDQQLATVGNTTPVREEISFHLVGGAVYPSDILVWIAIHEIWLRNKFIMVRLDLLWLGQGKTTIRR